MTVSLHPGLIALIVFGIAFPASAVEPPAKPFDSALLRVLPSPGKTSSRMMYNWLHQKTNEALDRRDAVLARLKTAQECLAYQARTRQFFLERVGQLPPHTPLNARVVARIDRPTFRVEKVLFESQPGFVVSAALFLPKSAPPYPAVLVSCGHAANGKACPTYQQACILMAEHGLAALIYDPIGQGERRQMLNPDGSVPWQAAMDHLFGGHTSILVGQNLARYMIWDGMRAIDYLQSREDVVHDRIGAAGNSGGGTQTAYLMALDKRIVAAAPSCYITHFRQLLGRPCGNDCEQNIYGQLDHGLCHGDYLMLHAPHPVLVCAAREDFFPIEGAKNTVAEAKRFYRTLGDDQQVALADAPGPHGWSVPLQSATAAWMLRWLRGRSDPVAAVSGKPLTALEIQCTPRGQVLLEPAARSLYDLCRDVEKRLVEQRRRLWMNPSADLLDDVRRVAVIRPLSQLPELQMERCGSVERNDCRVEKLLLRPEPGIVLPALLATPQGKPSGATWLVLAEVKEGLFTEPAGLVRQRLAQGDSVLAVDLRGVNETKRTDSSLPEVFYKHFDSDWEDVFLAYLLGRSYVGMHAEDILVCARWLGRYLPMGPRKIHLLAYDSLGPAALHAVALEPQFFASAQFVRMPSDWSQCVNHPEQVQRWTYTVNGALTVYDLPDLIRLIKAAKIHYQVAD